VLDINPAENPIRQDAINQGILPAIINALANEVKNGNGSAPSNLNKRLGVYLLLSLNLDGFLNDEIRKVYIQCATVVDSFRSMECRHLLPFYQFLTKNLSERNLLEC
jgi:hypothetical protein